MVLRQEIGLSFRPEETIFVLLEHPAAAVLELQLSDRQRLGGIYDYQLQKLRENYPLHFHLAGLAVTDEAKPVMEGLDTLKENIERYSPAKLTISADLHTLNEELLEKWSRSLGTLRQLFDTPVVLHPSRSSRHAAELWQILQLRDFSHYSGIRLSLNLEMLVNFVACGQLPFASLNHVLPEPTVDSLRYTLSERSALSHRPALGICEQILSAYPASTALLDGTGLEFDGHRIASCLAQLQASSSSARIRQFAA